MQVVCAWCRKPLGEKEPLNDWRATHGICDDCHRDAVGNLAQREPTSEVADTVWGQFEIGGEA